MSSSKQKVGRPGVAGQEAKKKDGSGRGSRCSQSEAHQPLKGKSFYLDVRRQAAKLKKDLEDLGGVVETFLSKDISYVVSDRPEVKLECAKDARQSAASPDVSTPSPFQQSKDSAQGAVDSPSAPGGSREGMVTRGKAIVQKATISQTYGTSNVLANARNWDVSIRHIDSVIKYVNKEKQKIKDSGVKPPQAQAQAVKVQSNISKERKLCKPSLKVEDASRHYRPASKELTVWPRVSFDSHSSGCPFDLAASVDSRDKRTVAAQGGRTQNRPDNHRERGETQAQTQTQAARPTVKATLRGKRNAQLQHTPSRQRDVGVKDSRRGYCECCLVKYSDLEKHLASEQHRNFVRENNHYVNLDLMIDEGPNIEQFLDDVMHHHEWQRLEGMRRMAVQDEVTLVSSPTVKKSKNPLIEPERPCQPAELGGEEQASIGSNAKSSQGQGTGKNQGTPQHVSQSASSAKSPRRKSNRLQSAAVTDEAAAAVLSAAAQEGVTPAVPLAGSQRAEPVTDDRLTRVDDIQDSQQHDRDVMCALPSTEKQHPRDIGGSPPKRSLRRHSGRIQKSSPAAPFVSSARQHLEGGGESPLESGGRRLSAGSPSPRGTPATPSRRQSSRLSLSARRRQQQQQNTKSPAEVPSVDEVPHETIPCQEAPTKQPADPQGDSQEGANIAGHTPNTFNKRPRSTRLSLTARKRLLKESAHGRPDPQCVHEETGPSVDERLKDQTQIQPQGTPAETDHHQEMGMNATGEETENQKLGDSSKPGKRSSKRKRDSDDVPDLGSYKNPKQRITGTRYQAHVQQKEAGRRSSRNRGTLEEHKAGENTRQSVSDPPRMERSSQNRLGQDHADDNRPQDPPGTAGAGSKPMAEEPNLESIFHSDPNVVQSSFLGFDSEDITETEQRLQQLSASSTTYTSKLQEAALNVFCIPSSELQLPEDDESSSSSSAMSNMEEVCVGMALRNLQNFPSDGSEWEFKVGGFMSVRLDKAMQTKENESILAKKCLQEKENMKENQYQQVLNIPSKLKNPVEAKNQENASRQLDHPLKKAQSATENSQSQKDDVRLRRTENRSRSLEPGLTLPRRALSFGSTLKTASHRENRNVMNQAKHLQFSPKNDPLKVVSPNRRVTFSPVKSQKPVCSTPKRAPDNRHFKLVFSPETPKEDREIIAEHYVHDLTEDEIDFPKFSSPRQSDSIFSPIKKFAKRVRKERRHSASEYKLKAPKVLRELSHSGSPRKSLFPQRRHSTSSMPCRVFHFLLNPPGSPRKRESSPSLPSSPVKQAVTNLTQALGSPDKQQQQQKQLPERESLHQITYFPANERNKVSPTFCTNSKPNFSSHILQPCNKKRRSDRLRSFSGQPMAPGSPIRRRPARTWSMCVSVDDDICCSEDVYEFTESTEGDTDSTTQQSNTGQNPALKDNGKKRHKSGQTSTKGKSKARRKTRANSRSGGPSTEDQPSDSSDQVVQEFGLPFSFFM